MRALLVSALVMLFVGCHPFESLEDYPFEEDSRVDMLVADVKSDSTAVDTTAPPEDTTVPTDTEPPPEDTAEPCPELQTQCGERCVDVNTHMKHCGGCGVDCSPLAKGPNVVGVACVEGQCVLDCGERFGDCNGEAKDGCEASLSKPETCGGCDSPCFAEEGGNGIAECVEAECRRGCYPTHLDCHPSVPGCETPRTTTESCGMDCRSLVSCGGSACKPVAVVSGNTTLAGFGCHCGDGDLPCDPGESCAGNCSCGGETGCNAGICCASAVGEPSVCTELSGSDGLNCGGCGVACAASESCVEGVCVSE